MNSSTMRNAAFPTVSILVCLLAFGLVGASAPAAAYGVGPSALEILPSPIASAVSPVADNWSLTSTAGVLDAPTATREYRVALLGGTGLVNISAIGQGVWGAAPTLAYPTSPAGYANDGVDPNNSNTGARSFEFRIVYRDTDGDTVNTGVVHIFNSNLLPITAPLPGSPYPMVKQTGTPAAGELWNRTVTLPAGDTYFYYFEFTNNAATPETVRFPATGYAPVGGTAGAGIVVNTAPALSAAGTTATTGTGELLGATFTVTYTDADNNAPTIRRLEVFRNPEMTLAYTGSPFNMTVDPGAAAALRDGNYVNGEQYIATVDLQDGLTYYWRFRFNDGTAPDVLDPDAAAVPNYHGPVTRSRIPTLTAQTNNAPNPDTQPTLIQQPTIVNFQVTYTDVDGDAPVQARLHIHKNDPRMSAASRYTDPWTTLQSPFTITTSESPLDVTNGAVYSTTVVLERPGAYYYYYSFTNTRGSDGTVTSPANAGPAVAPFPPNPYHGPVLITRDLQGIAPDAPYQNGANPTGGTGVMTTVTFRWRYKDLDEELPTRAELHIFTNADLDPSHKYGASPYNMTQIAGNVADAQGALYSVTVDLPSAGHYFYYFVFDNLTYVAEAGSGANATVTPINPLNPIPDVHWREPAPNAVPDYKQIVLVNQPAVLSDPTLNFATGGQWDANPANPGDDPYVFTVVYTDPDGIAPADGGVLLKVRRTTNPAQDVSFLMTVDGTAPAAQQDGDFTNGERYTVSVFGYNRANPGQREILDGDHTYYFEANDGFQTTRLPSNAPTGQLNGPKINDAPNPVTAGFDPTGGVVLDTASPDISWSPASDPNPTDTSATLRYRIEFSQTTGPFTPLSQYQRTTAAGVTTGQPLIPLPSGTWYYRIITIDDNLPLGAESVPSAEQQFAVNAGPELSDGSVAPASGLEANNFTFTVRYRDTDNDAPTSINVLVNRTTPPVLGPMAFPMAPVGAGPYDYTAGVLYQAVLTGAQIRDGAHSFYFETSDGTVATPTRFPAAGTIEGPTVNDPPNTVTSGFLPTGGAIVTVARPDMSWDPATDPNSTDPPSTLRYRIEFSTWDGDWGSPQYAAYTVTTAAGVTTAQPGANLPDGVWYYRIITLDNQTPVAAESVASATQNFQVQTTGPYWPVGIVEDDFAPSSGLVTGLTPTLTWPAGAHPTDGVATLRYLVEIYNNPTYTAPAVHVSPLLAAGVRTYNVPSGVLGGGTYYWRVRIRDRNNRFSPWTNETAPGPGLQVDFLVNRAPELAGGQVTPPRGLEADNFTFRVIYTDADDNAPTAINVFVTRTTAPAVGPTPFVMTPETPAVPGPGDYALGVTYAVTLTGAQIRDGDHTFYFEASDGLVTTPVRFPTAGGIEGPVVNDPPNAVTSGFNPVTTAPLTVVSQARPNISWDPASDPNSTDVPGTLRYRVEFSTTGAPADWGGPMFATYTVTTAAGITTAQPAANLPDGVWYYRIITVDNQTPTGAESAPSAEQQFQVATGGPYWPVATIEDDFAPSNGARTTATPTLSWPQGAHPTDAPATLRYQVEIYDNATYTPPAVHTSPLLAAGVRTYAVPAAVLTGGTYYWRVRIRDTGARTSFWTSDPAPGPNLVIDFNYTPTLSNGQVNPATAGVGANFVFQATYTDMDNRAPAFVNVSVTNTTRGGPAVVQAMAPAGAGPYDYRLGVVFECTITGTVLRDGEHTFFFQASDGVVTVNLYAAPPAVPFIGPTVNDPPFAPTDGFAPTGGVLVDVRQPLVSWNAGSDPNPSDTAALLSYRLEFSPTAAPFVPDPLYTAVTAPGVTNARPTSPLPEAEADWYWRVFTVDDSNADSLAPSATQMFHLNLNHAPAGPTPVEGYVPADDSTIRLTTPLLNWPDATDPDPLDTPATLSYDVQLDNNIDFSSPLIDLTTAQGVSEYQVVPGDGLVLNVPYYWRVRARDVQGATSEWSEVELGLAEPLEFMAVMNSYLANGSLTPLRGGLGTDFLFRVVYFDPDDLPPGSPIQVNIGGGLLVVDLARDPADPDPWTDGVTYFGYVNGAALGYGHFEHVFQIAGTAVVDPAAPATYDGPIIGGDSTTMFTDSTWVAVDTYEENDRVYIQVTDADENADPAVRDSIQVTVREQNGTDTEVVVLNEQGVNTGNFRGSLWTRGRPGLSGDGFLNLRSGPAGNIITATYTDKDGGDTSQDTALVVDTVAPPALAAGVLIATSGPSGVSVDLDWSAYDEDVPGDVAGYSIYQSTTAFGWTTGLTRVRTVPGGTQTVTMTGLTPGTVYFFAVGPYDSVPNEEQKVEAARIRPQDTAAPYRDNEMPAEGAFNVPVDSNISLDVLDDGVGVDISTVRLMVNGTWVTPHATIQPKGDPAVEILYDPPKPFDHNATVTVRVVAKDDNGNTMNETYEFYTRTDLAAPQVVNKQFDAAGGWLSFDITDNVSGVDSSTIVVQVLGADVTAACDIDDADPRNVSVRYDRPGGWGWNTPVNISVDCADYAGNVMPTETWQEQSLTDNTGPVISALFPVNGEQNAATGTTVSATITDAGSGVDIGTVLMTLEQAGVPVAGTVSIQTKGAAEVEVVFTPGAALDWDTTYNAHVQASDDEGNAAVPADWSFKTQAQPTFDISGNITDSGGDALAGVNVGAGGIIATTDGTGTYRIRGLVAGTYDVVPARAGYTFTPALRQVTVGPSQQQVNFVGNELAYDVSGRVTRGGVGVAGVVVSAGGKNAVTDGNGNYTIPDLLNGVYSVSCSRDADADGFQDFIYTPTSQTVNVADANVAGVNFTATARTYTVSGMITDSSGNRVANVTVSDGTRVTATDAAGHFTLAGVPAATVTITPTRTGMAFNPATRQVTVPPDASNVNFTAYAEFTHRFPAGRSMVALPLTLPAGQRRLVDIFQTTSVARWDPTANRYVRGDLDSPDHPDLQARPGAGWFVALGAQRDVTVAGDAVAGAGTFSLGLPNGWNMVGNMYQTALPLQNMNAAGGGELRPYGFIYDNATGSYLMVSRTAAVNSARTYLEAWEAGWFRAVGTTVSVLVTAPAGAAGLLDGPAAQAKIAEGGWVVPIVARAGGVADLCTVAGVGDEYQVENPPKLSNSVDVYFTDGSGARLAHDIRPLGAARPTWDFVVETDLSETRVELTLPDLSGVPADQVVYLTDVDAGKTIYARTTPGYSFTSDAGGAQRHFRLAVQPKGADNLVIMSASVQCSGAGAVVTYGVSRPCQVDVTVLNMAGRKVRSLAVARPAAAGSNVQTWDLRSDDGTLAPAGQYLVRIEAVADNGQRVQALRPLNVAR